MKKMNKRKKRIRKKQRKKKEEMSKKRGMVRTLIKKNRTVTVSSTTKMTHLLQSLIPLSH